MDKYFRNSEEKKDFVNDIFTKVVNRYDIFNDISSLGIHRLWKRSLIEMLPKGKYNYLDVATGSGNVALSLYKSLVRESLKKEDISIVCLDQNEAMLQKAKAKFIDANYYGSKLQFVVSSAEDMSLDDESVDYITVAFGARNFSDLFKGLKEMYRVLKKGGSLFILELCNSPTNPLAALAYKMYLPLLPKIGEFVVKDKKSYEYLADSLMAFPQPKALSKMLKEAGFKMVDHEALSYGIANIHIAKK